MNISMFDLNDEQLEEIQQEYAFLEPHHSRKEFSPLSPNNTLK